MVLVWGPAHTDVGLGSLYCSDINIQLINTTDELSPPPPTDPDERTAEPQTCFHIQTRPTRLISLTVSLQELTESKRRKTRLGTE